MEKIAFAQLTALIGSLSGKALDRGEIEHIEYLIRNGNGAALDDVHVLMRAMADGRKIEAIKAYRTLTGYGLKESNDAVEAAMSPPQHAV